MKTADPAPSRLKIVASAAFFFTYLTFHLVYPTLAWFDPAYDKFTWQMYSGLGDEPHFAVVFADGSRRETGNPQKYGSPIRILGPSIDQRRVVPPWLCANWEGAQSVVVTNGITGQEDIVRCQPAER